jgi:hypothetical protein
MFWRALSVKMLRPESRVEETRNGVVNRSV